MSDAYAVVDRLVAAINDHDLEAVTRCYSPQAVGVGPQGMAEGREELASFHTLVWEGFPDVHLSVWEEVACDDAVIIEASVTGTHLGPFLLPGGELLEPTGRSISVRYCWVFTVDEDGIIAQRVYYDQLELYTGLGAHLAVDEGSSGEATA
jgi:hypothetical protein